MRTEFVGDHLSRGIDFMGIVCPGGQEIGDRKSGDQMGSEPNVSQPNMGWFVHLKTAKLDNSTLTNNVLLSN